jgi:hypothetical protein
MEVFRDPKEEEAIVAVSLCFLGQESQKFSRRLNELIQQRKEERLHGTGYQEQEKGYQTGY